MIFTEGVFTTECPGGMSVGGLFCFNCCGETYPKCGKHLLIAVGIRTWRKDSLVHLLAGPSLLLVNSSALLLLLLSRISELASSSIPQELSRTLQAVGAR